MSLCSDKLCELRQKHLMCHSNDLLIPNHAPLVLGLSRSRFENGVTVVVVGACYIISSIGVG